MLRLAIGGTELFDEETSTFTTVDEKIIRLEHSLVSVSKWESKYKIPFLSDSEKSSDQVYDYINMMLLDEDDGIFLQDLDPEDLKKIQEYIDSSESATTFVEASNKGSSRKEVVTSEMVYYWMITYTVPFECETWHFNRLMNLLRICSIKNSKQKKMPKHEIAARNRELNAQRRAQLKTSG